MPDLIRLTARVSLLTALRIWVSLPDELGTEAPAACGGAGARPNSQVSSCNCSNQIVDVASRTEYMEDVELSESEDFLLLPAALETQHSPPSYTDCLTV